MRKNKIKNNLEKVVMQKVLSGQVKMKPKIFFILGSLLMFISLVVLIIVSVFLMTVTLFLFRSHGPGGQFRLEQILNSFPFWMPALGIIGIILGILLLKKYDFSYKKNFLVITICFIMAIIVAAWAIDKLGFNDIWFKRGPMRRFYRQWKNYNNTLENKRRHNGYYRLR